MDVFKLALIFIEIVVVSAVVFGIISWISGKLIKAIKNKLRNKKFNSNTHNT